MTTPHKPLVSVITVVRNGAESIAATLDSVREQRQVEVEHVLVDGASSDASLDIIKARQHERLSWISEPDRGIYDAMNKGVSIARGEWILFLGADDVLADQDVLADVFLEHELGEYCLVVGRSKYSNGRECLPRLDWHTLIFNTIHHQAVFYRRRLFDDFRYRLDIPVVADYELNFLAYWQHWPVLFLEQRVSVSGNHGVSHRSSQLIGQFDAYRIRGRYLGVLFNLICLAAGLLNLLASSLLGRLPKHN